MVVDLGAEINHAQSKSTFTTVTLFFTASAGGCITAVISINIILS